LNVIGVHFSSWEPDSYISAGLIDWKQPSVNSG
jgi:hypothetical protein